MNSKSQLHFLTSSDFFFDKEQLYLNVRRKESRIYSDAEVKKLPKCSTNHPHYKEWIVRAQSAKRLYSYLQVKKYQRILDIGCGNGWLAGLLSTLKNAEVHALDLNHEELQQATRVFADKNIQFYYVDLFKDFNPLLKFDVIILSASVQYFPDFKKLIFRLLQLLNNEGEIHLLDTPFYREEQLPLAYVRSKNYYSKLGFAEMANYYHPKSMSDLQPFSYHIKKTSLLNQITLLLKHKIKIKFPWVCITVPS